MSPVVAAVCCFVVYLLGYHFYAKRIARNLFELTGANETPAHALADGQDYVPAKRYVLFGHHFGSTHQNTMNAGFADGGMRRISYDIDRQLFDSFADRRDGRLTE